MLGLLWSAFDPAAGTIAVTGRVVRATGKGLMRTPTAASSKGTASVLSLPTFAVDLLIARAAETRPGTMDLVFPSTLGTLRDPNNFAKQWRSARADLGAALEQSTGHWFRKTLASLVTAETGDPLVAADALGHSDTATTLRHYISRNRSRPEVAGIMQRAVTAVKSGP